MDYQWIFCLIHLLLCTDIELLRMKEIMLFDMFQHVTKNQNRQFWFFVTCYILVTLIKSGTPIWLFGQHVSTPYRFTGQFEIFKKKKKSFDRRQFEILYTPVYSISVMYTISQQLNPSSHIVYFFQVPKVA